MTKTTLGRVEFAANAQHHTTVNMFFDVSLMGGQWLDPRKAKKADQKATTALFRESISLCQVELTTRSVRRTDQD